MKPVLYALFIVFLLGLLFFGCDKEKEEPQEPILQTAKTKYLHKVYMGEQLVEQYTWNEQKQLIKINLYGYYTTYEFTYTNDNKLDSIYFSYPPIGRKYSGKFHYDGYDRINKMDYKFYYSDSTSQHTYTIEYDYDRNNKINKATTILGNSTIPIVFEWNGKNISRIVDGFNGTSNYHTYDSLMNPYHTMPKIVLLGMAESAYCAYSFFIASENNYLLADYYGKNYEYKYDYDADGYPILSYMKENGQWKEFKK